MRSRSLLAGARARRTLAGAVLLAALAVAGGARAQSGQDKAAADVLFQQGKKLMQENKFAEACPKFAESNRLDVGIGTMLWLADCHERVGKTASAWGEFQEAAETAARQRDGRERVARQRAAALEGKLVRMKIMVPTASEVSGLEVTRDGTSLGKPLWGTAVPVDPGPHEVSASAPGYKTWESTVDATGEGKTVNVSVPKLAPGEPEEPRADTEKNAATANDAPSTGGTQRTLGLASMGAGVIGLGVGTAFGLIAKGHLDDSNANGHCRPDDHCDAFGVQARSDAQSAATLSTVFFVAGGVLVAGGAVLWLTAPKGARARRTGAPAIRLAPSIGRAGGGLDVLGAF